MDETTFPAEYTVHTASGTTDACERHANVLAGLMRFLGSHSNATPAPIGAQCANCINEAKNHG